MSAGLEPPLTSILKLGAEEYEVSDQVFGALAQDDRNPLSRVSVANSSFSLDPVRGCPLRCAYCTVAGAKRDLNVSYGQDGMIDDVSLPTTPEVLFEGVTLARATMNHPFFLRDMSVVSIGTASTECFLPKVEETTWAIVSEFLESGYKNPFWFVTKSGMHNSIVRKWVLRFERMRELGVDAVVSVSNAALPNWVEPYRGDRFRNIRLLKEVGVRVSHHLRPIIAGVNDSQGHLSLALEASRDLAEVVCVGELRRDPGVELGWEQVHKQDKRALPGVAGGRTKPRSARILKAAEKIVRNTWRNPVPVVDRSSKAIAFLLAKPDYNLYRFRTDDDGCFLSIPLDVQAQVFGAAGVSVAKLINQVIDRLKIPDLRVIQQGQIYRLSRRAEYREHRALIHALGHSGFFP